MSDQEIIALIEEWFQIDLDNLRDDKLYALLFDRECTEDDDPEPPEYLRALELIKNLKVTLQ